MATCRYECNESYGTLQSVLAEDQLLVPLHTSTAVKHLRRIEERQ